MFACVSVKNSFKTKRWQFWDNSISKHKMYFLSPKSISEKLFVFLKSFCKVPQAETKRPLAYTLHNCFSSTLYAKLQYIVILLRFNEQWYSTVRTVINNLHKTKNPILHVRLLKQQFSLIQSSNMRLILNTEDMRK